jgi:hypothetical protein
LHLYLLVPPGLPVVLLLPVVLPLLPKRKKLLLPRKRKNLTMTCLEVVSLIKSINTFHQWFLVLK